MTRSTAVNIDEYIADYPENVQEILQKIRTTIHEAAPGAEETINYGIPTFKLKGNLVHFAAYQKHIGFYPAPSGIEKFKEELAGYKQAKGSVQLPIDQEIPYNLISKIVRFRAEENMAKVEAKRGTQKVNECYILLENLAFDHPNRHRSWGRC